MVKMSTNFIEVHSVEEANIIDLDVYKFIGYDSGKYIFAKRAKQKV